jgi:polyketide cyclase/dehydrase/lipid transport protein
MTRTMTVSDSVVVAADPLTLWTAIADPTQMPRWSPENTAAHLRSGPRPLAVGETFVGSNRRRWMRWQTRCWVTASERGRCFEFRVGRFGVGPLLLPVRIARWRYTFEAVPGGTLVTETWFDGRTAWPDRVARVFDDVATAGHTFAEFQRTNIAATLEALRADFATSSS